ncbi:hypothetical protein GCM10027435_28680 [Haloparvum alkalitolerans]|uniref:PAS domain-containing sensor histidine kinase n=1 Tax=Haloparvum alkalitolerans TaxID=1042953 RepID=UPI003CF7BC31
MPQDSAPISVLCVDDEPGMAELIGTYLERFDDRIAVTAATTVGEALALVDDRTFDCIVSDYDMPEADGLVFLETVRAEDPDVPFLLFTGRGSEEIASDAISAGVTDYMRKESGTDQYRVLAQRLTNAVERRRLSEEATTAREHAEAILEASPNAILVGIEGRCVYANPAAVELFGTASAAELHDTSVSELFSHDGAGPPLGVAAEDGTAFEHDRLTAASEKGEIPVEGSARAITWDGSAAVVYILRDVSERVAYERELEYRRSLLSSTFEGSPDGILVTDVDRNVITYNDRFLDVWDLPEDVLASGDADLALETAAERVVDPDAFRESIEAQYRDPGRARHEQIRLADGTVLDQYSAVARTDDGDRLGFVWFYRDITELKRLERAQQEAFDRMTDAVFAVDEDWTFTFLNEQAERVLRRDADELLGRNVWAEFPEAVDTHIYEEYHEAVASGEPVSFETYYEPLDADLEIRAFPSETGLTVYFRDITEQRRTRSELQETVDTIHELYETASDTATPFEEKQQAILRIGGEYLDLPYGFVTELTETTQTVVASTGDHDLLQPGETCPLGESYCRRTVSADTGLLAVRNAVAEGWADGPAFDRFDLGTYIGGKIVVNGRLYGTVCFAATAPRDREFTEMERTFVELLTRWLSYELEHREQQSQLEAKNAQLSEFASIVSHDLRNPLSVADGYLDLAMEESDSDHLAKIAGAHERMNDLIEDILTLAREGEVIGELTHVGVRAVAEEAWSNVTTGETALDVTAEGRIVADESRVVQLLENLIRNAVEHGDNDITVRIGDLPNGFFVEDTGVGISEEVRATLFETGSTTKESGTGIGLRVVKQIATAHGWEIAVADGATGGARFEITGVDRPE